MAEMKGFFVCSIVLFCIAALKSNYVFSQEILPNIGHCSSIYSLKFSPDGKYLVSSDQNSLWNVNEKRLYKTIIRDYWYPMHLDFPSTGEYLACTAGRYEIFIFNTSNFQLVSTVYDSLIPFKPSLDTSSPHRGVGQARNG